MPTDTGRPRPTLHTGPSQAQCWAEFWDAMTDTLACLLIGGWDVSEKTIPLPEAA